MLKTVSKNFVKGLLLYSIILIAFALCFYTLLGTHESDPPDDVADFNNFVHPGVAIIKVKLSFCVVSVSYMNQIYLFRRLSC